MYFSIPSLPRLISRSMVWSRSQASTPTIMSFYGGSWDNFKWTVITVDFANIFSHQCDDQDYYDWRPWDEVNVLYSWKKIEEGNFLDLRFIFLPWGFNFCFSYATKVSYAESFMPNYCPRRACVFWGAQFWLCSHSLQSIPLHIPTVIVQTNCIVCHCRGQRVSVFWGAPSRSRDESLRSVVSMDETTTGSLTTTSVIVPVRTTSGE